MQQMERVVSNWLWETMTGYAARTQVGAKSYELSNHLGNVMAVISDRGVLQSAQDYYPFGMSMPGRSSEIPYKYGFNGQEKDLEMGGGVYTAEFWQYDARIGRRMNVDPVTFPWQSTYATFNNNPIALSDPTGAVAGDPPGGGEPPPTVEGGMIKAVEITAQRSNASPEWKSYISQIDYKAFDAFRRGPATAFYKAQATKSISNYQTQRSYHGLEPDEEAQNDYATQDYTASQDEAMDLLKSAWASENDHGNYAQLRASAISSKEEGSRVLVPIAQELLAQYLLAGFGNLGKLKSASGLVASESSSLATVIGGKNVATAAAQISQMRRLGKLGPANWNDFVMHGEDLNKLSFWQFSKLLTAKGLDNKNFTLWICNGGTNTKAVQLLATRKGVMIQATPHIIYVDRGTYWFSNRGTMFDLFLPKNGVNSI